MRAVQLIRGVVITLLLAELVMAEPSLAPTRVFRLPVWQEAGEWARSHQLTYWRIREMDVTEQYLISRVDEAHWQRLQVECGGDVVCTQDSCQQIRGASEEGRWLVPAAPDLLSALAGDVGVCAELDEVRWQGQALEQPGCWVLQQGQGCEVQLTPMMALQPVQQRGRLLVLLPDGGMTATELARALEMQLLSADRLQALPVTLLQLYSAEPGQLAAAQQWLADNQPEVLHQPDLIFTSGLQLASGGLEAAERFLFTVGPESTGAAISVGLIDTGVALTGTGGELIAVDFTGRGYQAGGTGTALASVLGQHLVSMRLFSYQACLPSASELEAYCYSSALIQALDQALMDHNRLIQLGPVGSGGAVFHHLITEAQRRGVVLVAGVGDAGALAPPLYPAAWPEVLAVTAIQGDQQRLPAALTGEHIDLAARGGHVSIGVLNHGQRLLSGTGLAAANVTGAVARLLQGSATVSPGQLYQYLRDSSDDLGPIGPDGEFGAGVINPCRAWRLLSPVAAGCRSGGGL